MNLQGYADHRKAKGLRGSTHVAVLNAINDGRISAPAVRRDGRRWIIDAALADQQWGDRTEPNAKGGPLPPAVPVQAPSSVSADQPVKGLPALAVSKAVRAAYDAKLTQLQYQRESEELISALDVKAQAFALARAVRDKLLGIADRLAPQLAATQDARVCHHLLSEEIRVALRGLADG